MIIAVPHDTISDVHLHRLLDNLFQAMVLIVGLDDLVTQRNLERTKRDLRAAYGLIDRLLETVQPSDSMATFGDLMGAVDCVVFPEANNVLSYLENFVETVDSTYGCVLLKGHIVAATKNWWGLHPDEIVLLTNHLLAELPAMLKDTPVFLPVKSPTVCALFTQITNYCTYFRFRFHSFKKNLILNLFTGTFSISHLRISSRCYPMCFMWTESFVDGIATIITKILEKCFEFDVFGHVDNSKEISSFSN